MMCVSWHQTIITVAAIADAALAAAKLHITADTIIIIAITITTLAKPTFRHFLPSHFMHITTKIIADN